MFQKSKFIYNIVLFILTFIFSIFLFNPDVLGGGEFPISSRNVSISKNTYIYTGSPIKPAVTVKFNNYVLKKDIHYTISYSNNTNPGTATITVKGKGRYSGTVTKNFTITKYNISNATISLSQSSFYYTGLECKPTVTIKRGSTKIDQSNYTVSYKNNINAGTAIVTITGKGKYYTGSKSTTFKINKRNLSETNIGSLGSPYYQHGSALKPSIYISYFGKSLSKDKDYTVSYSNNINVGTATMTITGKGKFSGKITKKFTIIPYDISGFSIYDNSGGSYRYTGKPIKPTISSVTNYNNTIYLKSSDYTVSYKNNINVGTTKIIITGKGNYCGSTTRNFSIIK
ncbi:MAG: hypothetical protein J5507_00785 [Clostridia bacterium]|nr:hypothetical protein [Clostridia bacterium]